MRDVSESLASTTSGQPWNLQPSRRITAEVGCGSNGCRLSWPWAHLQNGLGHDVPESMIARRKAAQIQAYELPRSHLMHTQRWSGANWEHDSWNDVPQCQNMGPSAFVEDSLQYRNWTILTDSCDQEQCYRTCGDIIGAVSI